jgi:hypothetical protein
VIPEGWWLATVSWNPSKRERYRDEPGWAATESCRLFSWGLETGRQRAIMFERNEEAQRHIYVEVMVETSEKVPRVCKPEPSPPPLVPEDTQK